MSTANWIGQWVQSHRGRDGFGNQRAESAIIQGTLVNTGKTLRREPASDATSGSARIASA